MNIITLTIIVIASFAFALKPALAASCSLPLATFAKALQGTGSTPQRDDCVCDKSLRNLEATLPNQMKLVAACGMIWSDGTKVNLAMQKASLDRDTAPYILQGEIFITIKAKLSGPLTYEVGMDERVWFSPVPPLIDKGNEVPVANSLRSLHFYNKSVFEPFHAYLSTSKSNSSCITSKATIEIDGIHLMMSESDFAGAYPNKFKVVRVGGFRPCVNR